MLYSKILVAYDGSEAADKALDSAIKLAKLNHYSKVDIIHVYSPPTYVVGGAVFIAPVAVENNDAEYSEQVVAKIKEKINDFTNIHIEVRQGVITKEILGYANEIEADLIVIGSRGLSGIGEFVLGSVSHNVVQHAKVPVLVIK
ncbi:universal stress protein [Paenibacillus doosanensis]|uniref:Universal stress protein n=1 Tax=Paenibacillus konkukensis TaxID=2020716 RepID=A0ABY4RHI5_9BACL|nr:MULTISPECIES: universal stress protein [Paenibacillus]MCS7461323.1 universal stress protein [Paenibacillus doosanensis]UQZ81089.1 Putative universal stress protein [Paenibacillus konkukensis]